MNKIDRNRLYKKTLEVYQKEIEAKRFAGTGLCWSIATAYKEIYSKEWSYDLKEFPEIQRHDPNKKQMFWFPLTDTKIREDILKQAIIETNDRRKNT
jgi:hypothetical protein